MNGERPLGTGVDGSPLRSNDLLCCGEFRTTPFCPMCGKKMEVVDPLTRLANHLALQLQRKQASLDKVSRLIGLLEGANPDHKALPSRRTRRATLDREVREYERWCELARRWQEAT